MAAAPDDAVLVHDVPLLVEKRMGAGYHLVVVVDAPVEDRVRRLVGRGLPEDDARRRIASQADDAQRRAAADVWLENAGTPQQLVAAVDRLWDERLVPFRDLLGASRPAGRETDGGGVEGDAAADRRLLDRVRLALGDRVQDARTAGAGTGDLEVVLAPGTATADLDGALLRAGFAPATGGAGERRYGSCDPGRPAALRVRTAG